MTPALNECDHMCRFCWRIQGNDFEVKEWAEPKEMLDALLAHQRKLLTGFNGDDRCSAERYKEAKEPNMVAISLAGEPIRYPYLSDFIRECHNRKMITFMVTNGTYPDELERLDTLPRQLYVTVAAPNEKIYKEVCLPKIDDGWARLMGTLSLFPSLDTRTVVRHTFVKSLNLGWADEYAELDSIADPDLVEPKGYVFVGGSRQRLSMANMPSHDEIKNISEELGDKLGMTILKEKPDSRVTLLGHEGIETDIRKVHGL
jgi:tRNA wybutosine-synthesizing protein 1